MSVCYNCYFKFLKQNILFTKKKNLISGLEEEEDEEEGGWEEEEVDKVRGRCVGIHI